MAEFRHIENGLLCIAGDEHLLLTPWGTNSVRVRIARGHMPVDTDYALLSPGPQAPSLHIEDREASLSVGDLVCRARQHEGSVHLRFEDRSGRILLDEWGAPGPQRHRAREYRPLPDGSFKLNVAFAGCETEHFYGMGQYQMDILDLKGCTLDLSQRNTQSSVPFYISSKGYGFLWHNPSIGRVTFGTNEILWESESSLQIDYWLTVGDTPQQISSQYADAVGHAPPMPEHGLGFWQCKLRYSSQDEILCVASEYAARGIKPDVIVCDFFHWTEMGDFRFDPAFFPDPKEMVEQLSEMGIRLVVSVWPTVSTESENYKTMQERGMLIRPDSDGLYSMFFADQKTLFYDTTNPEARDFVWNRIRDNYYTLGIQDYWLDVAEPEYSVCDWSRWTYHEGPGLQVGNLYPQAYARNFYEGLRSEGVEKPISLIRCAWAGSARYGALAWSGDVSSTWESFRIQVCAGLSMGVAGIPWWNSDIGGFSGGDVRDPAFVELLIRWFEWGAYCPVMRLHGDRNPHHEVRHPVSGKVCMGSGADNEIWSYGDEAYGIFRKYLDRRQAMRPYLRSIFDEAHRTGVPPMRPLWYVFPDDPFCTNLRDEYLFGPDLLVCPVLEAGARERRVYLPEGTWTDLETGRAYAGGSTITVPAPLDVIPVFERG